MAEEFDSRAWPRCGVGASLAATDVSAVGVSIAAGLVGSQLACSASKSLIAAWISQRVATSTLEVFLQSRHREAIFALGSRLFQAWKVPCCLLALLFLLMADLTVRSQRLR